MIGRRQLLCGGAALLGGCAARIGPAGKATATVGLRAMTLNLAHGRGPAFTQTKVRDAAFFRANLDVVAEVIAREQPHVVALQEAELGSAWAGGFDHVAHLAARTGLVVATTTAFVAVPGRWRYGTAILCAPELQVSDRGGSAFANNGRWRKGYSVARVQWGALGIDVTSLHLDHASAGVRVQQVQQLVQVLSARRGPHLVLGDFNDEAEAGGATAVLADGLDLRERRPGRRAPSTFPRFGRRLDWVLASAPLELGDARVLEHDHLSDHRAVVVDVRQSTAKTTNPVVSL